MDEITGLCAGCLRTLDEIACWGQLAAPEKQAVVRNLAVRRVQHGEGVLARWERSADAER
jgi:predicted Fe-S protein YdhL (DUF1289 family)